MIVVRARFTDLLRHTAKVKNARARQDEWLKKVEKER